MRRDGRGGAPTRAEGTDLPQRRRRGAGLQMLGMREPYGDVVHDPARRQVDGSAEALPELRSESGGRMTNHEHYLGTPEAASRMEVRFLCHPIRVQVWVTESMSTVTTRSQIIKEFTGVRDYLSWLESEYDDGSVIFEEDR